MQLKMNDCRAQLHEALGPLLSCGVIGLCMGTSGSVLSKARPEGRVMGRLRE